MERILKKTNNLIDIEKGYWDSVAHDYYGQILSPLEPGVGIENPIYDFVRYQLKHEKYERVADFGCGTGNFLLFLAQYFKEVLGIDYSEKMLEIARMKCRDHPNIRLEQFDMRNLNPLYNMFDIVSTINAISVDDGTPKIIFQEIYRSLRSHGLLIGIFPSFDTVVYLKNLTYEYFVFEKGMSEEEAEKEIYTIFIKHHKMDEERAMYADDGVHIQKFFYEKEIFSLLKKVGFKIIRTGKVLYPWELCIKHGYGDFPPEFYQRKDKIWDLFIVAKKT